MRLVVQRVKNASVEVYGKVIGKIDEGLLVLLGVTHGDTEEKVDYLVRKLVNLRIFKDENNKMNLSVKEIKGDILSVSQFTLYGDTTKGNRPSYIKALEPDEASKLYRDFNKLLKEENINVEEGIFQADMEVNLSNDGPVTIIIEK